MQDENKIWGLFFWGLAAMLIVVMLTGCISHPSHEKETYEILPGPTPGTYVSMLKERERRWHNSTVWDGKLIGFEIGYDPDSKSPKVYFRYGRHLGINAYETQNVVSSYGVSDASLLKGSLGATTTTAAIFSNVNYSEKEKQDLFDLQKQYYKDEYKKSIGESKVVGGK